MTTDLTKGLEFAADLAKQVIAVATGTLALTVTFAEKFDPDGKAPLAIPCAMFWAWGGYILAIAGAMWFLMSAAGSANAISQGNLAAADIMNSNTRWPALVMIAGFFVALVATGLAGWSMTR